MLFNTKGGDEGDEADAGAAPRQRQQLHRRLRGDVGRPALHNPHHGVLRQGGPQRHPRKHGHQA